jgi:broad specificity phosphatase PhoE
MARVVLIRHPAIARHWQGRCYGQSDVGLSSHGRRSAREISARIADREGEDGTSGLIEIVTSPLRRARVLAAVLSREMALEISMEPRLMECHFGAWEGQSWDQIWRQTGDAMMGMVEAPSEFRPGGGETTFAVRDRAMAWLRELPDDDRTVLAVSHGGPIAAIRGTLMGAPVRDWPKLVPEYGEAVEVSSSP